MNLVDKLYDENVFISFKSSTYDQHIFYLAILGQRNSTLCTSCSPMSLQ